MNQSLTESKVKEPKFYVKKPDNASCYRTLAVHGDGWPILVWGRKPQTCLAFSDFPPEHGREPRPVVGVLHLMDRR